MRRLLPILLCGCALDSSATVHVAPSAHPLTASIEGAVSKLNEACGFALFTAEAAGDGERVDGEIVARMVGDVGGDDVIGWTRHTAGGVVVLLEPSSDADTIAHELGHAAGLHHSMDPGNVMFPLVGTQWTVTQGQCEKMMEARR